MKFEVIVAVTTYEKVQVKAPSGKKANEIILNKFKGKGEVVSCNPIFENDKGEQVVGTSHLSYDDFGAFIRGDY